MNDHKGQDKENNSATGLGSISGSYVFDVSRLLYLPESYKCTGKAEKIRAAIRKAFKAGVLATWLPIGISVGTLFLLCFTVHYTRRQWLETNRSANASEIAANAAHDAAITASNTLAEMKTGQGAADTHTLAEQAVAQATDTKRLATAAGQQAAASQVAAEAARTQSDTSAKQLIISQRPWIYVSAESPSSLTFDAEGGHMKSVLTLYNSGAGPAVNVRVLPEMFVIKGYNNPNPYTERERFCDQVAKQIAPGGDVLFPGQPSEHPYFLTINRKDIEESEANFGGTSLTVYLVACVAYSPSFNRTERYYTGMMYPVFRNNTPGAVPLGLVDGMNLKPGEIILSISPFLGVLAR